MAVVETALELLDGRADIAASMLRLRTVADVVNSLVDQSEHINNILSWNAYDRALTWVPELQVKRVHSFTIILFLHLLLQCLKIQQSGFQNWTPSEKGKQS